MAEAYPFPVFHFKVDWDGTEIQFSEATGFDMETEQLKYRYGSRKEYFPMTMPGMKKWKDIELKRGVFRGKKEFYDWYNAIEMNTIDRKTITISLLDEKHEPVVTWTVVDAWPTKITPPTLKAEGNEIAVESITLSHQGVSAEFA